MNIHSLHSRLVLLPALLAPLVVGCPLPDEDVTGDEAATVDAYSILGVVTRAETAVPTGDGVGTLWIAVLSDCDLGAAVAGAAVVNGADFAAADAAVEFEASELAPGDYHLALFLDDDLDADPMMPGPDPGDLVYAEGVGDGVLSCVAVTVDVEDVEGVALVLTAAVPGG